MSKSTLLFIILFVFSVFLYTVNLSKIPLGVHGDEAETALQALRLPKDASIISSVGWYDLSHISFTPHALTMMLFGQTTEGNRVAAVLFGFLTLPFYFLLTKNLYSLRIAFFAFLFLSTSHLFIALSRIGTIYSQASFIAVLTFYFLSQAFQKKSIIFFALSGVAMGLTFYTYYAARAAIIIGFIWIISKFFIKKENKASLVRGVCVFLIFFFLTSLPISLTFFSSPSTFFSRSQEVFLYSPQNRDWLQSVYHSSDPVSTLIRQTQAVFTFSSDSSDQYGFKSALIDSLTISLLLVGFLVIFLKFTNEKFFLLFWFFTTVIVGQILTIPPLFVPRFVVGLPALFLICAIGLDWLFEKIKKTNRNAAYGFVTSLIFCIVAINIFNYFYIYVKMVNPHEIVTTLVGEYLQKLPTGTEAYFLTAPYFYKNYSTIEFLSPNVKKHEFISSRSDKHTAPTKKRVFVFHPAYSEQYKAFVKQNPSGKNESIYDKSGNPIIFLYSRVD